MPAIHVADRREQIKKELEELVKEGEQLHLIQMFESNPELYDEINEHLGTKGKRRVTPDAIKKVAKGESFNRRYQRWYSNALPVVEQLLPDRYEEFVELYRPAKQPPKLNAANFSISAYLRGITTYGVDRDAVLLMRLHEQVHILGTAVGRLDSALADITGVLEAELFDDELAAAKQLVKAKYLRSAGVVAGVVLERHLKRLIANHNVTFRKKSQISSLNDALKAAKVYDQAQWRQIQRLGDLRNLCGHDAEREPTKSEVEDLVSGVAKVTAEVF